MNADVGMHHAKNSGNKKSSLFCVDFMKSTYAWENGAVWCVNHGSETYMYYWSSRSFKRRRRIRR